MCTENVLCTLYDIPLMAQQDSHSLCMSTVLGYSSLKVFKIYKCYGVMYDTFLTNKQIRHQLNMQSGHLNLPQGL